MLYCQSVLTNVANDAKYHQNSNLSYIYINVFNNENVQKDF